MAMVSKATASFTFDLAPRSPAACPAAAMVAAFATDPTVPPTLDCALLATPLPAVNYLCEARLRLLSSLRSIGIAWSLWCGRCGALREGQGGAEPGMSLSGANTPKGGNSKKRPASALLDELPKDEFEHELHVTLAALARPPAPPATPPALAPQRRRKNPRCTACGEKFRRPTPTPPPFVPARTVARTRRASALAAEVQAAPPSVPVAAPAADDSASVDSHDQRTDELAQVAAANGDAPGVARAPPLTRTPSLAHLPTSHPDTPTYPKPPVVPPPAPNGASPTAQLPISPPAKKRKIKKSGLAKLLAHNAAREAQKSGSGSWGLG
ncbi:hypothetical protein Q8F55_005363 [Vanrija albida]|uniref:GATA-type domain-containing protein n=1 Tax=Vanrija albida TaxID=181172 RepID=A0ABR3Q1F9_9TREE